MTVEFEKTHYIAFEYNMTYEVCVVKTEGHTTQSVTTRITICDPKLRKNRILGSGDSPDIIPHGSSVTIQPGEDKSCVTSLVLDDNVVEKQESFEICLETNDDVVVIGTKDIATVRIVDNDGM